MDSQTKMRFDEAWADIVARKQRRNKSCLSTHEYHCQIRLVKRLKEAMEKGGVIRSVKDCRLLRKYDVVSMGNREWLVKPMESVAADRLPLYVTNEELFDVLHEAHQDTNHGNEEQMLERLRAKFFNVTREAVLTYLRLCENCGYVRQRAVEAPEVQQYQPDPLPMVPSIQSNVHGSSVYFGFVDMQCIAINGYEYIMVHWDITTWFVHLIPLQSVQARDVAISLLDIYATFGLPYFLDAPYEITYIISIINHLNSMWYGGPPIAYRQSSNVNDLINGLTTIQQVMQPWVDDVHFQQNWPTKLKFLQFIMNNKLESGSVSSPFEKVFGFRSTSAIECLM